MLVPLLLAVSLVAQAPGKSSDPRLKGPAVVVLLKDGCPCVRECRVALNALAQACRGKIRFVGIVDGDPNGARALARDAGLDFPVLADPRSSAIRTLKGRNALDLRLLGSEGRVAAGFSGLCRASVARLVDALRTETRKDVSLALDPFTVLPKVGCPYDLRNR